MANSEIEQLSIDTIRTLSMDAVQKANAGHPGTAMALAPLAYLLYSEVLRHNPANSHWQNRDRFILSAGHACVLQYSALHLTGYDLSLDDLKQFRQWQSRTPGHPERGHTDGIEITTGPLGQGFANGVGMGIAERFLAGTFNRPHHELVDHRVYVICSRRRPDGGRLLRGRLARRHERARQAHLLLRRQPHHDRRHDRDLVHRGSREALRRARLARPVGRRRERSRRVASCDRERAGRDGAPVDDHRALAHRLRRPARSRYRGCARHARSASRRLPRRSAPSAGIPTSSSTSLTKCGAHGPDRAREQLEREWEEKLGAWTEAFPVERERWDAAWSGLDRFLDRPTFKTGEELATRAAGKSVMQAFKDAVPTMIGGAADLVESTYTEFVGGGLLSGSWVGRNIPFGIREHAMGSIVNGIAAHGGCVKPYGSTFLIFSDYMRPAVRLSALMELPVVWAWTHDSVGLGEDGPTHQPVETYAALRAIPHLWFIRPADANETAIAWKVALERPDGPVALSLSRQKVPTLDRDELAAASGLERGAYTLWESSSSPDLILIATGAEVGLTLEAGRQLATDGTAVRVVSMPCWELFEEQSADYRDEVLPPEVRARLSVEPGVALGWKQWVGDAGDSISIEHFGASAPGGRVLEEFGFNLDNIVARAAALLERVA